MLFIFYFEFHLKLRCHLIITFIPSFVLHKVIFFHLNQRADRPIRVSPSNLFCFAFYLSSDYYFVLKVSSSSCLSLRNVCLGLKFKLIQTVIMLIMVWHSSCKLLLYCASVISRVLILNFVTRWQNKLSLCSCKKHLNIYAHTHTQKWKKTHKRIRRWRCRFVCRLIFNIFCFFPSMCSLTTTTTTTKAIIC